MIMMMKNSLNLAAQRAKMRKKLPSQHIRRKKKKLNPKKLILKVPKKL